MAIERLVECSNLPCSILIVGVGEADFSKMKQLDNDKGKLTNIKHEKMVRDCVQFVEFRKWQDDEVQLKNQLLMELPRQIEEYMRIKGIMPEHMLDGNPVYKR